MVGITHSWSMIRDYFSPVHEYKKQVEVLNSEIQRQKLRTAIAYSQLTDLKGEYAQILPPSNKKMESDSDYRLSQLSSAVRIPASVNLELSSVVMSRAKDLFKKKDYVNASIEFRRMIEKYPMSPQVVEAHFLLTESYFLSTQLNEAMDVIDKMITQYPENELTGFVMLRMGQILQERKRPAEAQEIYKLIIKEFGYNKDIKKQAMLLLNAVGS